MLYGHHESEASLRVGLMLRMAETPLVYGPVDFMTGEQMKPKFLALNRPGGGPAGGR
jgi:glutathione S-transferase